MEGKVLILESIPLMLLVSLRMERGLKSLATNLVVIIREDICVCVCVYNIMVSLFMAIDSLYQRDSKRKYETFLMSPS